MTKVARPWAPGEFAKMLERIKKARERMRKCPRKHEGMPEGKGEYIYADGDLAGYIPTPDETFPAVLHRGLSEDEAKFVREKFAKKPLSIAKPGDRFSMTPLYCKHAAVAHVHEQVVRFALLDYYFGPRGGRRKRPPPSEYAYSLIREF